MGTTGLSSRLDAVFRTTLVVLLIPAAAIALSHCALFRVLRGAPRSKVDSVYWTFGRFALRVGGTRLEVHGLENIRPGQGYVVVPNHESNWDPPALLAALTGTPLRFVVKKEITGIPIFGWAIVQTGSVRVERTGDQSDVDRIREKMGDAAAGHLDAVLRRGNPLARRSAAPVQEGRLRHRDRLPAAGPPGRPRRLLPDLVVRSSSGSGAAPSSSRWDSRSRRSTSATTTGRRSETRPSRR